MRLTALTPAPPTPTTRSTGAERPRRGGVQLVPVIVAGVHVLGRGGRGAGTCAAGCTFAAAPARPQPALPRGQRQPPARPIGSRRAGLRGQGGGGQARGAARSIRLSGMSRRTLGAAAPGETARAGFSTASPRRRAPKRTAGGCSPSGAISGPTRQGWTVRDHRGSITRSVQDAHAPARDHPP